jgi:hypothetical protein
MSACAAFQLIMFHNSITKTAKPKALLVGNLVDS